MYKKIYGEGGVLKNAPLALRYYRPEDPSEVSRLGFVIRKKVGTAPQRNLFRRIFKEAFRSSCPRFEKSVWLVFDLRSPMSTSTRQQLRRKADELLKYFFPHDDKEGM